MPKPEKKRGRPTERLAITPEEAAAAIDRMLGKKPASERLAQPSDAPRVLRSERHPSSTPAQLPKPLPAPFSEEYGVTLPGLGVCELIQCFVCQGTGVPTRKHPVLPPCPNCAGYGWQVYSAAKMDRALSVPSAQRLIDDAPKARSKRPKK